MKTIPPRIDTHIHICIKGYTHICTCVYAYVYTYIYMLFNQTAKPKAPVSWSCWTGYSPPPAPRLQGLGRPILEQLTLFAFCMLAEIWTVSGFKVRESSRLCFKFCESIIRAVGVVESTFQSVRPLVSLLGASSLVTKSLTPAHGASILPRSSLQF